MPEVERKMKLWRDQVREREKEREWSLREIKEKEHKKERELFRRVKWLCVMAIYLLLLR